MRQGNRPEILPLHAIAGMLMRILVSVVVIVAAVIVAAYFALGRPDALFAGGAFPQLVSGAQNLSAAVPAPDSALASILRIAVIGGVIVLVVLIGAIGIWDAWQSRHHRDAHSAPGESGRPDAHRRSSDATDRGLRAPDLESLWSPEIARMHTRRSERAPTDPDTLQGGTA
jgi:hypothetical protein